MYCFDSKWNKKKPEKKQRHFYVKQRTIYQTEWKYTSLRVLNMTTMVILGHTILPSGLFSFHNIFELANTLCYSPNYKVISGTHVPWKFSVFCFLAFYSKIWKRRNQDFCFGFLGFFCRGWGKWAINFHVYMAYSVHNIHELFQVSIGNCWHGASEG